MNIYEIAKKAIESGSAQNIRYRESNQYDAKPWGEGNNRGWVLLDAFTAGAIVALYESLSEAGKSKYIGLPLPILIDVTWKVLSKN